MLPPFETLTTRADGTVLFVEIDAPPINLLGPGVVRDLVSLIRILDEGEPYRVAVFTSANPDFFIAHVDITQVGAYRAAAAELTGEPSLGLLLRRLSTTKAVTIAQIAGRVRGAGNEFVLACDMRFASLENALFAQFECGMGIIPGAGGIQHIARLMGRGRALEALLGAEDFDARAAEHYGWINRALPDAELGSYVSALARRIGRFPVEAISTIKQRVDAVTLASADDYRTDSDLFGAAVRTPSVQARMQRLLSHGMQEHGDLEMNFGRHLADLSD